MDLGGELQAADAVIALAVNDAICSMECKHENSTCEDHADDSKLTEVCINCIAQASAAPAEARATTQALCANSEDAVPPSLRPLEKPEYIANVGADIGKSELGSVEVHGTYPAARKHGVQVIEQTSAGERSTHAAMVSGEGATSTNVLKPLPISPARDPSVHIEPDSTVMLSRQNSHGSAGFREELSHEPVQSGRKRTQVAETHNQTDDDEDEDDDEERRALSDENEQFVEMDPSARFGRYDEMLGCGSSKVVYRGFDEVRGIEVAWNKEKLACKDMHEEGFNRLEEEVRILKNIRHKNIIKIYASWIDKDTQVVNFITEIFNSGTLRRYATKHKHVDMKVLKSWARQILSGLVYLHEQTPTIIHRDLKCENIFINGANGEVKIADLGVATFHSEENKATHTCVGTPEYMAPELYEEQYDEKVDIYSFGMCILELRTREHPFSECSNRAQVFKKVMSAQPPAALEKVKEDNLREFVQLCISPQASDRPSAAELLKHAFLAKTDEKTKEQQKRLREQRLMVDVEAGLGGRDAGEGGSIPALLSCPGSQAGSGLSLLSLPELHPLRESRRSSAASLGGEGPEPHGSRMEPPCLSGLSVNAISPSSPGRNSPAITPKCASKPSPAVDTFADEAGNSVKVVHRRESLMTTENPLDTMTSPGGTLSAEVVVHKDGTLEPRVEIEGMPNEDGTLGIQLRIRCADGTKPRSVVQFPFHVAENLEDVMQEMADQLSEELSETEIACMGREISREVEQWRARGWGAPPAQLMEEGASACPSGAVVIPEAPEGLPTSPNSLSVAMSLPDLSQATTSLPPKPKSTGHEEEELGVELAEPSPTARASSAAAWPVRRCSMKDLSRGSSEHGERDMMRALAHVAMEVSSSSVLSISPPDEDKPGLLAESVSTASITAHHQNHHQSLRAQPQHPQPFQHHQQAHAQPSPTPPAEVATPSYAQQAASLPPPATEGSHCLSPKAQSQLSTSRHDAAPEGAGAELVVGCSEEKEGLAVAPIVGDLARPLLDPASGPEGSIGDGDAKQRATTEPKGASPVTTLAHPKGASGLLEAHANSQDELRRVDEWLHSTHVVNSAWHIPGSTWHGTGHVHFEVPAYPLPGARRVAAQQASLSAVDKLQLVLPPHPQHGPQGLDSPASRLQASSLTSPSELQLVSNVPNQVVNSKDDELIGFEEDHADEDTLHAQEERILEEKQRREQEELKQRHEAEKHRMKMRKSSKAGSGRSTLGRGASHKSLTSEGCGNLKYADDDSTSSRTSIDAAGPHHTGRSTICSHEEPSTLPAATSAPAPTNPQHGSSLDGHVPQPGVHFGYSTSNLDNLHGAAVAHTHVHVSGGHGHQIASPRVGGVPDHQHRLHLTHGLERCDSAPESALGPSSNAPTRLQRASCEIPAGNATWYLQEEASGPQQGAPRPRHSVDMVKNSEKEYHRSMSDPTSTPGGVTGPARAAQPPKPSPTATRLNRDNSSSFMSEGESTAGNAGARSAAAAAPLSASTTPGPEPPNSSPQHIATKRRSSTPQAAPSPNTAVKQEQRRAQTSEKLQSHMSKALEGLDSSSSAGRPPVVKNAGGESTSGVVGQQPRTGQSRSTGGSLGQVQAGVEVHTVHRVNSNSSMHGAKTSGTNSNISNLGVATVLQTPVGSMAQAIGQAQMSFKEGASANSGHSVSHGKNQTNPKEQISSSEAKLLSDINTGICPQGEKQKRIKQQMSHLEMKALQEFGGKPATTNINGVGGQASLKRGLAGSINDLSQVQPPPVVASALHATASLPSQQHQGTSLFDSPNARFKSNGTPLNEVHIHGA